jgi:hypothetical protein
MTTDIEAVVSQIVSRLDRFHAPINEKRGPFPAGDWRLHNGFGPRLQQPLAPFVLNPGRVSSVEPGVLTPGSGRAPWSTDSPKYFVNFHQPRAQAARFSPAAGAAPTATQQTIR